MTIKENLKNNTLLQAKKVIEVYRILMKQLEEDLNGHDEARQKEAAVALKTFDLFLTEEHGFTYWNQLLLNVIQEELIESEEKFKKLH